MSKKPQPNTAPKAPQEEPLNPASLPYRGPRILWPAIFVLNLLSSGLWWLGYWTKRLARWLWHHPWKVIRFFLNGFFRVATLLSVAYLVYDRAFESDATISSLASDPSDPFRLPFTVTNNSHLFYIREIAWQCGVVHIETEHRNTVDSSQAIYGTKEALPPGQTLNIDCNFFGPTSRIIRAPPEDKVTKASISIQLAYKIDIFGIYQWIRHPRALFTYYPGITYSQWIRGAFAR